ncbi:HTH domain-containing protein [Sporosarcina ureae]|uniref:HTH domain-containing protein n=1 Tax=Sporosarcina ureae TaxID=1571 RepID=UPI0026EC77B7|nr:HTH domain-containing protein [Sporosarcina ureae]
MKVTIALIGSQEFCKQAETIVLPQNIRIDCYQYRNPSEAPSLLDTMKPCHAILFSGSLPYEASEHVLKTISVPVLYLQQNEHTIAVTLLYLASEKNLAIYDISIDIKDRSHIEHILRDLDTLSPSKKPAIHELQRNSDLQAIVNFHVEHFRSGQSKMAVTSVHAVYNQLKAAGIPAFRMLDPVSNTLRALEQAAHQASLERSKATKIAVGLLKVHNKQKLSHETVVKLANYLQAKWSESEGFYYFYTSLGTVEFVLALESFVLFINSIPEASLSFGLGQTIVEASDNAWSALQLASNEGIFMLDEHKQLHGPLPSTNTSIAMKLEGPKLLAISKKTTLSPAVISKIIQFNQFRQSTSFTAHDLAGYLAVSRRTAERTIKKLMDHQFIQAVGEEMTYSQGRPRALYEMKLPHP